jgi:hypothetical protein
MRPSPRWNRSRPIDLFQPSAGSRGGISLAAEPLWMAIRYSTSAVRLHPDQNRAGRGRRLIDRENVIRLAHRATISGGNSPRKGFSSALSLPIAGR